MWVDEGRDGQVLSGEEGDRGQINARGWAVCRSSGRADRPAVVDVRVDKRPRTDVRRRAVEWTR